MSASSATHSVQVRWARLFSTPPGWLWLLLPLAALWPVWAWSAARLTDGSDDPLGILALLALLLAVWRDRAQLAQAPRPHWFAVSLGLSALAALSLGGLPPLLRGVIGVAAVLAALLALRAPRQPLLAWFGLGLLALPVISSLQFFAGYPLRVLTAEISALILRAGGLQVLREGSALQVAGHLVMVDAPCSGIQMAWVAYFTACATAAWLRLPDSQFLRRLPLLGAIVIGGNVLRNTVLIIKESGLLPLPAWTHEGIGLLVFAGVCALVLRLIASGATPAAAPSVPTTAAASWRGLLPAALFGFAFLAVLPLLKPARANAAPSAAHIEWPQSFEGRALRPLALSAVEERFSAGFPGAIARFSDGNRLITLRHVTAATRKLHPAADCYRGLGYAISHISLSARSDSARPQALQRCFVASKGGRDLLVCEYIEDAAGRSYTDASAWYWAATTGDSTGPWRAVTVARMQ